MTDQPAPPKKSTEEVLTEALAATDKLDLKDERASAVRLATKALLVIRGVLNPKLFQQGKREDRFFNPYPIIAKHIRAANADTLAGLVNYTILEISPNFADVQAAGRAVPELFVGGETEREAVLLLKDETIPLVLLMKDLYKQARGFDEADQPDDQEATP